MKDNEEIIIKLYNNIDNYNIEDELKILIINQYNNLKLNNNVISANEIINIVYEYYNIDSFIKNNKIKFINKSRKRELVEYRQSAMFFMLKYTALTQATIGSYFEKDHATALHSKKTIKNEYNTNKLLKMNIDNLNNIILKRIKISEHNETEA